MYGGGEETDGETCVARAEPETKRPSPSVRLSPLEADHMLTLFRVRPLTSPLALQGLTAVYYMCRPCRLENASKLSLKVKAKVKVKVQRLGFKR